MHLWISIQRGGGEGEDWMSIWSQLFKSEIVLSSGDTGKSLSTGWELPKSIELSSRYHPLNNQGQEFCFLSSQDNIQKKDLSLIHISEPTRPLYISYAVFCLKKNFLLFFSLYFSLYTLLDTLILSSGLVIQVLSKPILVFIPGYNLWEYLDFMRALDHH